jgi:glycerol-3-phosphate dehydrogenase
MRAEVVVVGAGAVGSAIARELLRLGLDVLLVDAAADVGTGTSKANTAIWHTGFDALPDTLEAALVARGHALLTERADDAGWTLERVGAVLVAWDDDQLARLPQIKTNAERVGYRRVEELSADQVYAREPNLGWGVRAGLFVPDEGLLDPWAITLGSATDVVVNGGRLLLDTTVTSVTQSTYREESGHVVSTTGGDIETTWLVNAAGLGADHIDRMLGRDGFTVTPRRGELIVFDKLARPLISHIVLPVPTATTKGVLVSPTTYGNVLLGPTADDVEDRTATGTTSGGLEALLAQGRRIMPRLVEHEVTATYAGLRAATEHGDYCYDVFPDSRYVRVGGIRSTGVSAALALAERVAHDLADAGVVLQPRTDFVTTRLPSLAESGPRSYRDASAIAEDPDRGRIVCFCERVSRAEIRDAMRQPIPARDVDALRRRTRALMGRCQGFFCSAHVTRLLAEPDATATDDD